jgi:hypothetical protein
LHKLLADGREERGEGGGGGDCSFQRWTQVQESQPNSTRPFLADLTPQHVRRVGWGSKG